MKSMRLNLAAIFFMTYFYRTWGGGMAPSAPWIRYCQFTCRPHIFTNFNILSLFLENIKQHLTSMKTYNFTDKFYIVFHVTML